MPHHPMGSDDAAASDTTAGRRETVTRCMMLRRGWNAKRCPDAPEAPRSATAATTTTSPCIRWAPTADWPTFALMERHFDSEFFKAWNATQGYRYSKMGDQWPEHLKSEAKRLANGIRASPEEFYTFLDCVVITHPGGHLEHRLRPGQHDQPGGGRLGQPRGTIPATPPTKCRGWHQA